MYSKMFSQINCCCFLFFGHNSSLFKNQDFPKISHFMRKFISSKSRKNAESICVSFEKQSSILKKNKILFSSYVSDFQSYIDFHTDAPLSDTYFLNILMYADDLVFISCSEVGLQGLIDKVCGYCKRWTIIVHTDKMKTIKFSGNGYCCKTIIFYGDKFIENVISHKYLCLAFNASGTWSNPTDKLSTRGSKAPFTFKRYIRTGNIQARSGLK